MRQRVAVHGRTALPALAIAIVLVALPQAALAHGGEDLSETPARALLQQALGLLTQTDEPVEAAERLEAALESEDQERVQLRPAKKALVALEAGDTAGAAALVKEALEPPEDSKPAEPASGTEGSETKGKEAPMAEDEAGGEEPALTEEALEGTEELDPERGTEEWLGFGLGAALIAIGLAALGRPRRAGSE